MNEEKYFNLIPYLRPIHSCILHSRGNICRYHYTDTLLGRLRIRIHSGYSKMSRQLQEKHFFISNNHIYDTVVAILKKSCVDCLLTINIYSLKLDTIQDGKRWHVILLIMQTTCV